jgi:transposase-like protein
MRYPASEKLEIIRLVEQSHLPVRRLLEQIGISRVAMFSVELTRRLRLTHHIFRPLVLAQT